MKYRERTKFMISCCTGSGIKIAVTSFNGTFLSPNVKLIAGADIDIQKMKIKMNSVARMSAVRINAAKIT